MLTIKTFPLTQDIRQQAWLVGKQRDDIAKKLGRSNGYSSFRGYQTTLEMHWLGAIAELFLQKQYPFLCLGQPLVVDSADTNASDFIYQGSSIEVKCHCWHVFHDTYFVNALRFDKKGHLSKILVCCVVNNEAWIADSFSILGWIETNRVNLYPKNTEQARYSPAYEIPLNDLKDMDDLLPRVRPSKQESLIVFFDKNANTVCE